MKLLHKLFICFLVVLLSYSSYAQNGHMTFKGIELDGSLADFIPKLEKQGFTLFTQFEGGAAMKGTFTGKKVTVLIPCKAGEVIWNVTVDFEEEKTWSELKYSYMHYKELLTAKYGNGESYEFFKSPYYEGDGYEMSAVKNEKCIYVTYFNTPEGSISLEIYKATDNSCCIRLRYEDNQNASLHSQKRQQQEEYDDL